MCLYVREFSVEESETLSRWLHRPSSVVVMRRAQILARNVRAGGRRKTAS